MISDAPVGHRSWYQLWSVFVAAGWANRPGDPERLAAEFDQRQSVDEPPPILVVVTVAMLPFLSVNANVPQPPSP